MNKLSFRARAIDPSKSMAIVDPASDPEILNPANSINRAVLQMPTGMEKEEEEERHIQEAIAMQASASSMASQVIIPIPDASIPAPEYSELYPSTFKMPRDYIRYQPKIRGIDEELPVYDADEQDQTWLQEMNARKKWSSTASLDTFETIIEKLDEAFILAPLSESEAVILLRTEENQLVRDVYSYYCKKKISMKQPTLRLLLKEDKPDGAVNRDPYVCFRRRTEKMQTRKNRKNDESSYMNMTKLRRDMDRARTIIDLVRKREKMKRESICKDWDVYEARFRLQDWDGSLLERCAPPPSFKHAVPAPAASAAKTASQASVDEEQDLSADELGDALVAMRKRKKLRRRLQNLARRLPSDDEENEEPQVTEVPRADVEQGYASDTSSAFSEPEYDLPFRFKRRANVLYHEPWSEPVETTSDYGQYALFSPSEEPDGEHDPRPFRGYCRHRIGRGGRVFIDRERVTPYTPRYSKEQERDLAELKEFLARMRQGDPTSLAASQPTGSAESSLVQLPIAGNDFGLGDEDVGGGPKLHVHVHQSSDAPVDGWIQASQTTPRKTTASGVQEVIRPLLLSTLSSK